MKRLIFASALLGLLAVAPVVAQATPITIFNTGVDASATPLPDGTVGDPHYSLITVPGGTTDERVRTSAGGFPIPPWLGDSATSAWIGPNNDAAVDGPAGNYDYRTTFTTPGAGTFTILGQWATDNPGIDILVDGAPSGSASPGFTAYTPFSLAGVALAAGTHTLDFIVNNQGGPTGVRVEITSANFAAVPEPTSCLLFGLGALGLFVVTRRRNG